MNDKHPLDYILRLRKPKEQDIDSAFDMVCAQNYFTGQFGGSIEVEKNRQVWSKLKELLNKKSMNDKQREQIEKILPLMKLENWITNTVPCVDEKAIAYNQARQDCLNAIPAILEAYKEELREEIEEYFKGLIFMPDPQATKESLLDKLFT